MTHFDPLKRRNSVYSARVLCPTPCRTGWPVGAFAIWSNIVLGFLTASLALAVPRRHRPPRHEHPNAVHPWNTALVRGRK